ncbi:MAG: hypothetical protein PUF31_03070, partial [Oscillospiraceae bacterium]|nr:hypothetical protein [Oscillospiraceae bacterium]
NINPTSENAKAKLFKSQFSGASGNKINNTRKPYATMVFGLFLFRGVPFSYHFRYQSIITQQNPQAFSQPRFACLV